MRRRRLLYSATALVGAGLVMRGCSGLIGAMAPTDDVTARINEDHPQIPAASFPPGKPVLLKKADRPLYIWHRNRDQIALAKQQDTLEGLRDNRARLPKAPDGMLAEEKWLTLSSEWIAVWGLCTRRFCVPLTEAGDFGGFFCPCCGSHYDLAGRIRKGIAPQNLQVIPLTFNSDRTLLQLTLTHPPKFGRF